MDLLRIGATYFPFNARYFSCAIVNDTEWAIDVTQSDQSLEIYGITISNVSASLVSRKLANNTRAWNGTVSGTFNVGGDSKFSADASVSFDSLQGGIQKLEAAAILTSPYIDLAVRVTYEAAPSCVSINSSNSTTIFNSNNPATYLTDYSGSVTVRVKSILPYTRFK